MEQEKRLMTLASNVKLFAGMPTSLLGRLIGRANKITIDEGKNVFSEGDIGDSFFILIIGHVVVEQSKDGQWIELAQLHPGDSFGEMALVDDKVRSARVRATSDCVALHFVLSRLEDSPEIMSSLYQNIARILVKRLKNTNNVILELSVHGAPPKAMAPTTPIGAEPTTTAAPTAPPGPPEPKLFEVRDDFNLGSGEVTADASPDTAERHADFLAIPDLRLPNKKVPKPY
jgi:CRP-like cAMP-binding protein